MMNMKKDLHSWMIHDLQVFSDSGLPEQESIAADRKALRVTLLHSKHSNLYVYVFPKESFH